MNMQEISEALLYANVPYFLFKKVVTSRVCFDFSRENSTDVIRGELFVLLRKKEFDIEDVKRFYLYIGALYIKGDFDFNQIDQSAIRRIYWAKEVIGLILKQPIAQNNIAINVPQDTNNQVKKGNLIITHSSI